MLKPYKYLIGYLSGLFVMLFIFAVILVTFHTRPMGLLPIFEQYTPESIFETQKCDYFTQVPYATGFDYSHGEVGYCTLNKNLPTGITQISLYMKGSFIASAVFHIDRSYQVQDFLFVYGKPIKINQWGHTTQVNWSNIQITYEHLDGGSVDNVKIRYVFIH